MNVHIPTPKVEARWRHRLREREKHLLAAARLFEDMAHQARKRLGEARRGLAAVERIDELARRFDEA